MVHRQGFIHLVGLREFLPLKFNSPKTNGLNEAIDYFPKFQIPYLKSNGLDKKQGIMHVVHIGWGHDTATATTDLSRRGPHRSVQVFYRNFFYWSASSAREAFLMPEMEWSLLQSPGTYWYWFSKCKNEWWVNQSNSISQRGQEEGPPPK